MAWKERCVMDERLSFMAEFLKNVWGMAELCRRYGISRRVGYKWVERYKIEGVDGLHVARRHHAVDIWISSPLSQMCCAC